MTVLAPLTSYAFYEKTKYLTMIVSEPLKETKLNNYLENSINVVWGFDDEKLSF